MTVLLLAAFHAAPAHAACNAGQAWRLTWADEFDGPDPSDPCYDPSITWPQCGDPYGSVGPCADSPPELDGLNKCNWTVMERYNWMDNGLPGVNAFDRHEVRVEGGELVLSAHANPLADPAGYDCSASTDPANLECPILSGGLWGKPLGSVDGFGQTYGRWEVRARLNVGPGSWPAHWLLPVSGGWPEAGEIDIMEAVGWVPDEAGSNYHGGTRFPTGAWTHYSRGGGLATGNDAFATEYHVFAVEWSPDRLDFYIDGTCTATVRQGTPAVATYYDAAGNELGTTIARIDLPDIDFHWVLNTTIANFNSGTWDSGAHDPVNPDPYDFDPQEHRIDYVRVYSRCPAGTPGCARVDNQRGWRWVAGNESHVGDVAGWGIGPDDAPWSGDFDGDGVDQLLLIDWPAGEMAVLGWAGSDWVEDGSNAATPGWIDLWAMDAGDAYVVGDFDGDGRDDLAAFSDTGWSQLMFWNGAGFDFVYGNDAHLGQVGLWYMAPDDTWLAGDFDGDGVDDLVAISTDGWFHLMRFDTATWDWSWTWGAYGQVGLWYLAPDDRWVVGDWDGDGADELIAIASSGWIHRMHWDGTDWVWDWGNDGNGRIALRDAAWASGWVPGDFYADGRDDLLIVDTAAETSHLVVDASPGTWQFMREDPTQLGLWYIHPGDRYVAGDFRGLGHDELVSISDTGWLHLTRLGG